MKIILLKYDVCIKEVMAYAIVKNTSSVQYCAFCQKATGFIGKMRQKILDCEKEN